MRTGSVTPEYACVTCVDSVAKLKGGAHGTAHPIDLETAKDLF